MAGKNSTGKKGFSGLSDLVSEVDLNDGPQEQAHKKDASPPPQAAQPQQKDAPPKSQTPSAGSTRPVETAPSSSSGSGSVGKFVLVGIGACFVLWLAVNGGQSNRTYSPPPAQKPQNYSAPQSSPAPAVAPARPKDPQSTDSEFMKLPPVGTGNLLSLAEIRWCIGYGIAIDTLRDLVNTDKGIAAFKRMFQDHGSRCESYRYTQSDLEQARREVEKARGEIVSVITKIAQEEGFYRPSPPSLSSGAPPEKAGKREIEEAQRLLANIGYAPGPADGRYGRRTADAVKAFQQDVGLTPDGVIGQGVLALLRTAAEKRNSQAKQPPPTTGRPTGIPANAHITYSNNWECDRGFRLVNNECVKVRVPANGHITYGSNWECDRGFKLVSNECVKVNVPANGHITYGSNWECDRGFRLVKNECVKVRVPANGHITYGSNWECDRGFRLVKNECVKVRVPANGHITYGSNWECDRGFKLVSNECVKVNVPANGHITYGSNWECDRGFRRVGNECVK